MTNRDRLLTVIGGGEPDCVPWSFRIDLWYRACRGQGRLPEKYRGFTQREIELDLGMAICPRVKILDERLVDTETQTRTEGKCTLTEYITPVGKVSTKHCLTEKLEEIGIETPLQIEYMIKTVRDYSVVEYIIEHTEYLPQYEVYLATQEEIGDEGIPVVLLPDCPTHEIMRNYIGYEKFFYELNDHPERIEHLIRILTQKMEEMLEVVIQSPGLVFIHGEHFDSQMTPPPLFERYFLPYYRKVSSLFKKHGKWLSFHLDANSRLLLPYILKTGMRLADCFTTEPMVDCTLSEARRIWGERVVIWGGIPSIILCPDLCSEGEFQHYLAETLRVIAPGKAFILGVADNVVPEASFDRLLQVTELIDRRGKYPIQA